MSDQVNQSQPLATEGNAVGHMAGRELDAAEREICGAPRFEGGWGSICYQPKGHRPPHIFECGGDDDD